jgi:hypothetical protein
MAQPNFFIVYHARVLLTFGVRPPFDPATYERVAYVIGEDLDAAFHATNHIESDWQRNANVVPIGDARTRARSTSVGDVIVQLEASGELCPYYVVPCGFEQVTADRPADNGASLVGAIGTPEAQADEREPYMGE